ncbi:cytochrome P450 [Schizophyllum commune]
MYDDFALETPGGGHWVPPIQEDHDQCIRVSLCSSISRRALYGVGNPPLLFPRTLTSMRTTPSFAADTDTIHLDVAGKFIVVLDSYEAAVELLEKRSKIQGSYFVNSVPALKWVPGWMPGTDFKRVALLWRGLGNAIVDKPFREVKESMINGSPPTLSFTLNSLEKGADEVAARDAAATIYNGGTDTTVVTLLNFTLAILDHPEMQHRAQAELDTVLGPLQTPTGVPGKMPAFEHESMMHNEITYPDPFAFEPERFMTAEGKLDP